MDVSRETTVVCATLVDYRLASDAPGRAHNAPRPYRPSKKKRQPQADLFSFEIKKGANRVAGSLISAKTLTHLCLTEPESFRLSRVQGE